MIRRGDLTVNNPDLVSWLAYFDSNAAASDLIPWDDGRDVLTADERTCIESSIAKFQLGEYSEGHSLLTFAAAFADELGEQCLVSITRHFIKEEQKHALMLKRFMQSHGMRTLQRNWTDTVFRRLRKCAGYEASITVLITAELIALVYYRALQACTRSQVLVAICKRILEEEAAHTRYESELLRFVRERRTGFLRHVPEALHRFLYAGTIVVVFVDHRRVLRRGGYGLADFWSACWGVFGNAFSKIDPTLRTTLANPPMETDAKDGRGSLA
jgi:hypothetical protein